MADSIQFRKGLRSTVKPLPAGMPGFITDEQRLVIGNGDGSTNAELPNKQDIDNINSQMAELPNKQDIDNINSQMAEKVNNDYVLSLISSITDGSPKDLFFTLDALKAAYPNGAAGTFLVLNVDTEGAHTFMWKDNSWVDLGLYSGKQIKYIEGYLATSYIDAITVDLKNEYVKTTYITVAVSNNELYNVSACTVDLSGYSNDSWIVVYKMPSNDDMALHSSYFSTLPQGAIILYTFNKDLSGKYTVLYSSGSFTFIDNDGKNKAIGIPTKSIDETQLKYRKGYLATSRNGLIELNLVNELLTIKGLILAVYDQTNYPIVACTVDLSVFPRDSWVVVYRPYNQNTLEACLFGSLPSGSIIIFTLLKGLDTGYYTLLFNDSRNNIIFIDSDGVEKQLSPGYKDTYHPQLDNIKIEPKLFTTKGGSVSPSGLFRYSGVLNSSVVNGVFNIGKNQKMVGLDGYRRAKHCIQQPTNDFLKDPEIQVENGIYYAFMTGVDENNQWEIQYATAPAIDGAFEYQGAALTREGKPANFGTNHFGPWAPTLIKFGNMWHMYVTDMEGTYRATAPSLNGTWTWDESFYLSGAFDWHIKKLNGVYVAAEGGGNLRYRTSIDLNTWSEPRTIIEKTLDWQGGVLEAPFLVPYGNKLYCFYGANSSENGQRIGCAVTVEDNNIDGSWNDLGEIDIVVPEASWKAISHPALIRASDWYYLFFCGTNGNATSLPGGAYPFRIYRYKSKDLYSWEPVDFDTNILANKDEMAYINAAGKIELTTEEQDGPFYPLARIETDSEDITQIDPLMPWLYKGEKITVVNGDFTDGLDGWETFNELGTVSVATSIDKPSGFDQSVIITANTLSTGGVRQTIYDIDVKPGDYIIVSTYAKNLGGDFARLTAHLKSIDDTQFLSTRDDQVSGFFPWQPLVCVLRVPTRNRSKIGEYGSPYHGKMLLRVQLNASVDIGQSVFYTGLNVRIIRNPM